MRKAQLPFLLFALTFLSPYNLFSQETFLEITLDDTMKNTPNMMKESHLVLNDKTGDMGIFLEEEKTTYGFLYNKNKEQIGALKSEGLKRRFKEVIGKAAEGYKIMLLQKNTIGNRFGSIIYDFKNNTTKEIEYDFKVKKEKFLQSYSHGNAAHAFTILKNTNSIKQYTFTTDGEYSTKIHDFKAIMRSEKIGGVNLFNLLTSSYGFGTDVELVKIESDLPNTIEIVCNLNKMYENDKGFQITLDDNKFFTVIMDFTLPDLTPSMSLVKKPVAEKNQSEYETNSFLKDNTIFQIISNSSEMILEVKDMEDQSLLKTFTVKKDDPITIKNTPILQEGSMYSFGKTRKMEKTSKFLRKIAAQQNGIAVLKTENGYKMTIGGIRKSSAGGGMPMMMPGMPVGGIGGGLTMSFNPAAFAYGSYTTTGSTRIESLLGKDLNHIEGEISENVFDHIKTHADKIRNKRADNVFYINSQALFGNYSFQQKKYTLYAF